MNLSWNELLPGEYRSRVVAPLSFERHDESAAHASKVIGYAGLRR